jgi:hypothetical protein
MSQPVPIYTPSPPLRHDMSLSGSQLQEHLRRKLRKLMLHRKPTTNSVFPSNTNSSPIAVSFYIAFPRSRSLSSKSTRSLCVGRQLRLASPASTLHFFVSNSLGLPGAAYNIPAHYLFGTLPINPCRSYLAKEGDLGGICTTSQRPNAIKFASTTKSFGLSGCGKDMTLTLCEGHRRRPLSCLHSDSEKRKDHGYGVRDSSEYLVSTHHGNREHP